MLDVSTPDAPLTVSEAARAIGVAEATIRNWSDRGKLYSVRTETGRRIFRRADVEIMKASRELSANS